jgi:hypothetical protein
MVESIELIGVDKPNWVFINLRAALWGCPTSKTQTQERTTKTRAKHSTSGV